MTTDRHQSWLLAQLQAGAELYWICTSSGESYVEAILRGFDSHRVVGFPESALSALLQSEEVMLGPLQFAWVSGEHCRQLLLVPVVLTGPVLPERTRCLL